MLIIGRPDSGKTHLLYELLTNQDLYFKKFNRVLYFTPGNKIGGLDISDSPYWSPKFDIDFLFKHIKKMNEDIQSKYKNDEGIDKAYG